MAALLQFFENIIIKLIDKMNILFILLLLLLFGVMNKNEVFEWIEAIGNMTSGILP